MYIHMCVCVCLYNTCVHVSINTYVYTCVYMCMYKYGIMHLIRFLKNI